MGQGQSTPGGGGQGDKDGQVRNARILLGKMIPLEILVHSFNWLQAITILCHISLILVQWSGSLGSNAAVLLVDWSAFRF